MTRSLAIVLLCLAGAAGAHDAGHHPQMPPDLRQWFNSLTNQGGANCCSMADGLAIGDPDWEIGARGYRVRVDGRWLDVPPEALVSGPNRAGAPWVWPVTVDGVTEVRCFLPGAGG